MNPTEELRLLRTFVWNAYQLADGGPLESSAALEEVGDQADTLIELLGLRPPPTFDGFLAGVIADCIGGGS